MGLEEMSLEEVARRLEKQGGKVVLDAVSPRHLKTLKKEEEEFDPSNPVVSAKTLGKLIKE